MLYRSSSLCINAPINGLLPIYLDFNSIKQTLTIKGSNGLYLCLGRKYTRYLYGRFAMRFLTTGQEYDWKFLLYIEPEIESGDGENDDFVQRKKYECNK